MSTANPPAIGLDTATDRWHAARRVPVGDGAVRIDVDCHKVKDDNPDIRRAELAESFLQYMRSVPHGTSIFAEEPIALKNGKTTRLLGLAAGAIWAQHLPYNCYWHWVDIATWKSFAKIVEFKNDPLVLAAAKAKQEKMKITMCSIIRFSGDPEWDQDHHDANLLAAYGDDHLTKLV